MNFQRFQSFESYLKGVKNCEEKPELGLGSPDTFLGFAILSLASLAVIDFEKRQDGIRFMKYHDALGLVAKYTNLIRQRPADQEPGIFIQIAVAHVACLLELHEASEHLVTRAQWPGRHFWNEYARAMLCLVEKRPYEPKLSKFIGSQKYWAAYLPFISDITNDRDWTGSLEAMRQSFQKRQTDKRITDDGGVIVEGSAKQPTHWDFRAEAIKAYAAYKYGLTFSS